MAASAQTSERVGRPSHIRSSMVPKSGWGRMSHQTSRMELTAADDTRVSMSCSKSAQFSMGAGRPAVGRPSNTLLRLDANPVSRPSQKGLDADRASRWGM